MVVEVEVAEKGGRVEWKPSRVMEVRANGHFVACVNGDPEFLEEFGPEDENTEWRFPAVSELARVTAAYEEARASGLSQPSAHRVEAILGKQRLTTPAGAKEDYFLVKWANYSEGDSPNLNTPLLVWSHTVPHLTSPHLNSSHLTSIHPTSPHRTPPHPASPPLTSTNLTSPNLTSVRPNAPPHPSPSHHTSPHPTTPDLPYLHSPYLTSPQITTRGSRGTISRGALICSKPSKPRRESAPSYNGSKQPSPLH